MKPKQGQIESAAFNVKYLASTLVCFAENYTENPKHEMECARTIALCIINEVNKITETF